MTFTVKTDYLDKDTAARYDRERFSSAVGRTFDYLEKRALCRVLRQVLSVASRPRVLDVPCGTGRITELWLQQGLTVLGGDISTAMIAVAREKCDRRYSDSVDFRQLDLDALDIPDSSMELVTCIRLFHHLTSPERAKVLRELARVTSKYVIINVSYSSWYYRFRRNFKRILRQGISRSHSTWGDIQSEAQSAGLKIIACRMVLPYVSEDMIILLEKKS